jgi:hypothetical protein
MPAEATVVGLEDTGRVGVHGRLQQQGSHDDPPFHVARGTGSRRRVLAFQPGTDPVDEGRVLSGVEQALLSQPRRGGIRGGEPPGDVGFSCGAEGNPRGHRRGMHSVPVLEESGQPRRAAKGSVEVRWTQAQPARVYGLAIGFPVVRRHAHAHGAGEPGDRPRTGEGVDEARAFNSGGQPHEHGLEPGQQRPLVAQIRYQLARAVSSRARKLRVHTAPCS